MRLATERSARRESASHAPAHGPSGTTWVQTCRSPCHAWTAALERTDVARSDAVCVAVLRPGDAALVRRFTRVAPAAGRGWIPGVYGRATVKERTRFGRTTVVCQGPQLRVLARDVGRAPHQCAGGRVLDQVVALSSGIRTGQYARPRRIVAEPPDLEAGSLRGQPGEVGRRVGARVRDVLRRGEHPHAIRIDIGMEGELRPIERSANELGAFTQVPSPL